MKRSLPSLAIGFVVAMSLAATVCAQDEKPASYALTKVRLLAKPGTEAQLAGGRILGSQESATTAMVPLAQVAAAPAEGQWLEVAVTGARPYRYVKFAAAPGTSVCLAGVEFHSATGRLEGSPFGSNLPKEKEAVAFPKAFDGDAATWFEFPDGDS